MLSQLSTRQGGAGISIVFMKLVYLGEVGISHLSCVMRVSWKHSFSGMPFLYSGYSSHVLVFMVLVVDLLHHNHSGKVVIVLSLFCLSG
jgi:hypothetical protein